MTTIDTTSATPVTITEIAALERYVAETARDLSGDRAAAVRAMRDEPGEVAAALHITATTVALWCDEQSA
jgi:hypothetical protein